MLKQWLRKRVISWLVPSDPSIPDQVRTESGLLDSAYDCFLMWRDHFESATWQAEAKAKNSPISKFVFHWSGIKDDADGRSIQRPDKEEKFDAISGIKSNYQYFMLRPGAQVLVRPRSCWCNACLSVAMNGPGVTTKLNSQYMVGGNGIGPTCDFMAFPNRANFYTWKNESCAAIVSKDVAKREKTIVDYGHMLAPEVKVGDWVIFEAFSDNDDDIWVGRATPFPDDDTGFVCCRQHKGARSIVDGTRFDDGDYKMCVQWYERTADCDDERREFIMGLPEVSIANSGELRACGFAMGDIGAGRSRRRRALDDTERKWFLPRVVEAAANIHCR